MPKGIWTISLTETVTPASTDPDDKMFIINRLITHNAVELERTLAHMLQPKRESLPPGQYRIIYKYLTDVITAAAELTYFTRCLKEVVEMYPDCCTASDVGFHYCMKQIPTEIRHELPVQSSASAPVAMQMPPVDPTPKTAEIPADQPIWYEEPLQPGMIMTIVGPMPEPVMIPSLGVSVQWANDVIDAAINKYLTNSVVYMADISKYIRRTRGPRANLIAWKQVARGRIQERGYTAVERKPSRRW
jgi:hypothetical protein